MKYEAIMFDLDGTLWNATDNIIKAWDKAIGEFDELKDRQISEKELQSVFGMPMDTITDILFPELSKERQDEVMQRCCEVENDYLNEHGGVLYPGLLDTLKKLCETHKLFIVSNGQAGYIESFLNSQDLWDYFTDIRNWGDNPVSKGENIKLVMEKNNIKSAVYVGDTKGDADSAAYAGIDFIFASYGFGDVKDYTYSIDSITGLLDIEL
ncbi:MAG: HAD family hydrolase [Lachnospiraceae bacterium]|nr:HAD family hydrolase [Lachnospiraceae bacterium]